MNESASHFYVIPAEVFEDERIEATELKFYGLLSGLARSGGHCYASDDYLSRKMKVNEKTIGKWLQKLESLGYVKRETKKIGMRWDRKIFLCHAKVSNKPYEPAHKRGSNQPTSGDRTRPQADIILEEINNISPPLPPPPRCTQEEEEELQRRFKNRPKDAPPVVSRFSWDKKVLKDMREDEKEKKLEVEKVNNLDRCYAWHKMESTKKKGTSYKGYTVIPQEDSVYFKGKNGGFTVPYRVSSDEWQKQTGWTS